MAIQVRRGNYADFDPDKMLPGEWATATSGDPNADDGMAVYMCFKAGKVKRMATYDDMKQNIEDATSDVADDVAEQLEENINEAIQLAQSASSAANSAAEKANSASQLAQSASSAANSAASAAQEAAQEAQNAADNVKNDFYGARSSFPVTGETKKLYVDNTVNPALAYIWNGSDYIPTGGGGEFTASGTTILMQSQRVPKSFRSLEVYGKSTQDGTPSPENPVPIETAGNDGTVDVNLTGANLFDASKIPTKSAYGATVTNNGDGSFTVSGSGNVSDMFTVSYTYSHEETILLLKPGVIKANFGKLTSPKCYFQILTSSGTAVDLNNSKGVSVEGEITRDLLYDPSSRIRLSFYTASGSIVSGITKPMVYQEGDGTWEPYKIPQTFHISTPNGLTGIPVESGGNYTDETGQQWIADVKDYGTGKYTQNCAIVTFDGSEDERWAILANTGSYNRKTAAVGSGYTADTLYGIICDNFIQTQNKMWTLTTGNIDEYKNEIALVNNSIRIVTDQQTVEEWKAFLQSNPITVLYQLSTPIVTDISAEEMEAYKALKTYTPTTVISSDSGVWMEADLVDSDILYPHAENTSYDNSTSGLTSDNVQGAIDENAAAIGALNSRSTIYEGMNSPHYAYFVQKAGASFANGNAEVTFELPEGDTIVTALAQPITANTVVLSGCAIVSANTLRLTVRKIADGTPYEGDGIGYINYVLCVKKS